jgi:5'(3')-deoxyribonucleotidase
MPELKTPQEVIKSLTTQYDVWARTIQKNNMNTQGEWLETDSGSIYIRNMARGILSGNLVVCLANIQLNSEYQNKGILEAFIRHVQKNPYAFTEIEVENIHTKEFLKSFLDKGYQTTMDINMIEVMPLTVFKKISAKDKSKAP